MKLLYNKVRCWDARVKPRRYNLSCSETHILHFYKPFIEILSPFEMNCRNFILLRVSLMLTLSEDYRFVVA